MTPSELIGQNLRALRRQCGLTQEELARRAQVSRSQLRNIEYGKGNPTLNTLQLLADALHVEVTQLIGGETHEQGAANAVYAKFNDFFCELFQGDTVQASPLLHVFQQLMGDQPDGGMGQVHYFYQTTAESYELVGYGPYVGYGICCAPRGGEQTAARVDNISLDRPTIDRVVALCNMLQLDPVHLRDVVEDILAKI